MLKAVYHIEPGLLIYLSEPFSFISFVFRLCPNYISRWLLRKSPICTVLYGYLVLSTYYFVLNDSANIL
jgi:hypothetical protein